MITNTCDILGVIMTGLEDDARLSFLCVYLEVTAFAKLIVACKYFRYPFCLF